MKASKKKIVTVADYPPNQLKESESFKFRVRTLTENSKPKKKMVRPYFFFLSVLCHFISRARLIPMFGICKLLNLQRGAELKTVDCVVLDKFTECVPNRSLRFGFWTDQGPYCQDPTVEKGTSYSVPFENKGIDSTLWLYVMYLNGNKPPVVSLPVQATA